MKQILLVMTMLLVYTGSIAAQKSATVDRKATAEQVKAEFLHAWNGYKKYAWGNDDLKPITHYYLGDADEIARAQAAVAAQGKAK